MLGAMRLNMMDGRRIDEIEQRAYELARPAARAGELREICRTPD